MTVRSSVLSRAAEIRLWFHAALALVLALAWPLAGASAASLTNLYSFTDRPDVDDPKSPLIFGPDGDGALYGTAFNGGTSFGGGVFKLSRPGCDPTQPANWCETVLYSFCSVNEPTGCSDGRQPYSGVIFAGGALYGTTVAGGTSPSPRGTVFKLTLTGTETVLYSFCSKPNCSDGASPEAGVIFDAAGNL
jgi:uncharacterized repeat protein (TIGR03803 family)